MMLSRTITSAGAAMAAVVLLSACSAAVPEDAASAVSTMAASGTPTAEHNGAPEELAIFAQQSQAVLKAGEPRSVLLARGGTGSVELSLPPLPAGHTRLGLAVNCTAGHWRSTIEQATPAQSSSRCAVDGVPSADFPLDDPTSDSTLTLQLEPEARYWVTVYSR